MSGIEEASQPEELTPDVALGSTRIAAALRLATSEPLLLISQLWRYPGLLLAAVVARRKLRRATASIGLDEAIDLAWGFRWKGGALEPLQNRVEISRLLHLLARTPPRVVVEIGTYYGATLFFWSRIAAPDATLIAIDLSDRVTRGSSPRAVFCRGFRRERQRVRTLFGRDSTNPDTRRELERILDGRKIDFLFIDGDHHYDAVAKDFSTYADLVRPGGLIAFHDIAHKHLPDCETAAFWNDFKRSHDTDEFVEDDPWPMGIGLFRPGVAQSRAG